MELARFAPDFVASERLKMRRFEEGLAFYSRNYLVGQPIQTYQELYDRAAEVERVKGELRALSSGNQKRKWNDRSTPSGSVAQKKPAASSASSRPAAPIKSCAKFGRTNHTTADCRVGTNRCMWCGSPDHLVATCPTRQKALEKRVARPAPPPRQGSQPLKSPTAGRAYIISKKEAAISGTVVTGTLFLNSTPFCVLFD